MKATPDYSALLQLLAKCARGWYTPESPEEAITAAGLVAQKLAVDVNGRFLLTHSGDRLFIEEYLKAWGRSASLWPTVKGLSTRELDHSKRSYLDEIALAKVMVVGAKVYRVHSGRIEEGVVERVARCRIASNGDLRFDPDSPMSGYYPYYAASFGTYREWESQTYDWKFFVDLDKAKRELVREHERRIADLERRIAEHRKVIAENSPPAVCTPGNFDQQAGRADRAQKDVTP